jgi:vacuolar-type H+-ATPase subunit I/STV1
MTDALKDLDYYAANPDEMPTDPDQIAALMAQMEGNPAPEQAENDATAGVEEAKGEDEKTEEAPQQVDEEAPIASKDGKHTIPYDVLKSERERRKAAEQAMQELQARIEAMQQTGKPQEQAQGEASPDELDQMAEDFPAVAKLLEHTRKLEQQLQSVSQRIEQEDRQRQEASMSEVRAAVDANPTLLHWEHNDPDRWAAAIEADTKLQASPAHRGLTLEQRLAKAVEIVDAFYGPDQAAPRAQAQPQEKPAKKAAAAAKSAPRTLSDILGGAVPPSDPVEEFAQMSADRLGAQMANMTPDQITALLARLG